jgi:hypothetical protein
VDTNRRRRFVVLMLFDFKQIWFYIVALMYQDIYITVLYEEEKCYVLMDKH